MASQRQIEANRRNAQKCTGPKTGEGKRKSRYNALVHGMTAQSAVLPHEDDAEFILLRSRLVKGYAPANEQELQLIDQIAVGYWRTIRARALETDMLEAHIEGRKHLRKKPQGPDPDNDDRVVGIVFDAEDPRSFENFFRYEHAISRHYFKSIELLEKMQGRRLREEYRCGTRHPALPLPAASEEHARNAPAAEFRTMTASAVLAPAIGHTAPGPAPGSTEAAAATLAIGSTTDPDLNEARKDESAIDEPVTRSAGPSEADKPGADAAEKDESATDEPVRSARPSEADKLRPEKADEQESAIDEPVTRSAGPSEAEVLAAAKAASAADLAAGRITAISPPRMAETSPMSHKTLLQEHCPDSGLVSFRGAAAFVNRSNTAHSQHCTDDALQQEAPAGEASQQPRCDDVPQTTR